MPGFVNFRGTLAFSKVLAIPTGLVETARTPNNHTFIRKLRGHFFAILTFSGDLFLPIIVILPRINFEN